MKQTLSGQRLEIGNIGSFRLSLIGPHADRVGLVAIGPLGSFRLLRNNGHGEFQLDANPELGERFDIIAYIQDDRQGGFVNDSYPFHLSIGGDTFALPVPDQRLAAVILGEIYSKNGSQRLKVSNEGFIFGITAYLRARNLEDVRLPGLGPPSDRDLYAGRSGAHEPPNFMASGSGVLVGPGLVATNAHVVEDCHTLHTGRARTPLHVVTIDLLHDLALLEGDIDGQSLPLRIGAPLWLGENVMAVGYPLMDILGSDIKVSTGNISGLTGSGGDVSRFQFTAPIGSGSSGGAVTDEFGNLVGITSASLAHGNMRDRGAISENVNFGIRASMVFELVASVGRATPSMVAETSGDRRTVVNRLRNSVISILVNA
jgi:S1-C subfamily serine protease